MHVLSIIVFSSVKETRGEIETRGGGIIHVVYQLFKSLMVKWSTLLCITVLHVYSSHVFILIHTRHIIWLRERLLEELHSSLHLQLRFVGIVCRHIIVLHIMFNAHVLNLDHYNIVLRMYMIMCVWLYIRRSLTLLIAAVFRSLVRVHCVYLGCGTISSIMFDSARLLCTLLSNALWIITVHVQCTFLHNVPGCTLIYTLYRYKLDDVCVHILWNRYH